jgi:Domain of unknown function (DUF4262)
MARELNDFEKDILYNVETYGCHINYIFDNKSINPSFSYSVGLFSNFQQPEILIIGLKQELSHILINNICLDYKESKSLKIGAYNSDILDGFDCLVLEVDKNYYEDYVLSANWYYEERDFPVVQIIYPTINGVFPWEKDFPNQLNYPILNKNYRDFI